MLRLAGRAALATAVVLATLGLALVLTQALVSLGFVQGYLQGAGDAAAACKAVRGGGA